MNKLFRSLLCIAAAALPCSTAAALTCAGTNDTAAVQAAVNAGGVVELTGSACALSSTINLTVNHTALRVGPNGILSSANPAFVIAGTDITMRGADGQPTVWATAGVGVQLGTSTTPAGRATLSGLQINAASHGIVALNGFGGIIERVHLNGDPNVMTYAMMIMKWDTLFIPNMIVEEYQRGIRIYEGSNFFFGSLVFDRLNPTTGVALWAEPMSGKQVSNIQVGSLWASNGAWPILLDAGVGAVAHIQVALGYYTGFTNQSHTTNGSISGFQHPTEIFNP